MKLLILGGTGFLGPHIVEYARPRGHTITLFNRGKTNPKLFPDLEKLQGDRDPNKGEGLRALEGRKWDAAIDTSGYFPRAASASANLLAPNIKQYIFISTISVFSDFSKPGIDENTPVGTIADESNEDFRNPENYGPLKALCEKAVEQAMPGRTTNIRPGLIVGPRDPTDRFTYWPVRVDRGGEVLAPGNPDAGQQFIDARDLAGWSVRMAEDGHAGVYNATGPKGKLTMQEVLHGCKCVAGSEASFTWVEENWLMQQNVQPWMELPLWIPSEGSAGFAAINCAKAINVGLTFRPTAETIKATLDWHKTRPEEAQKMKNSLQPEKEAAILKAWRDKNPASQPATQP